MMFTNELTLLTFIIAYYLVVLLAIFLVVRDTSFSNSIKIFLGLVFLFLPFSGFIYAMVRVKRIPQLVK